MFIRTLRYGKGYAGKMGNKCWIATITGSDKQYGLSRSFLDADSVEREHFNRPRTMINFSYSLDVGLYEQSEGGNREFFVVWIKNGEHVSARVDSDRVKAMVALMDDGMSADDARRETRLTNRSSLPAPQPTEQPKGE